MLPSLLRSPRLSAALLSSPRRFAHLPSAASAASRSLHTASTPCSPLSAASFASRRSHVSSPFFQHSRNSHSASHSAQPSSHILAVAAAASVCALWLLSPPEAAHSCGIVAVVDDGAAAPLLLEGLRILQNRGYDSAGLSTIDESGDLVTTKYASAGSTSDSIKLLEAEAGPRHASHRIGIAHTRWATHGGKTDANAHPHLDYKRRIALVHNGTIENSAELKRELEAAGIAFLSQTDTEVIAQLIGHYLDAGLALLDAIKRALSRLEGTWGLAILHREAPLQIVACCNGSPLVVGLNGKRMFVASEVSAFSRHTNQFISLKDGEIAVIGDGQVSLDLSRAQTAPDEHIELSPAPFPHWTIKEIMEQPQAISKTLNYGGRFDTDGLVKLGGLQANADMLLGIDHLVISACGTSLFAGMYGAAIFRSLKCFDTVQVIDAAEMTADNFGMAAGGGLLVISQSGETKDTHRALQLGENMLLPCFSVVNQVGSLIARTTSCGVYLNAGREHAVASTKAFTTQVAALALTAGWFSQNRLQDDWHDTPQTTPRQGAQQHNGRHGGKPARSLHYQKRQELIDGIHRLPIYAGIALRTRDQCHAIAQSLSAAQHMFILGKGYAEPIAREGALKIKEITYVHAEGYSGGALKHGPFALLDDGLPVVLLIFDDAHADLMRVAGAEVKARGARTIVITDKKALARDIADKDDVIVIPSNGPLTALLAALPLQLLAYEMAVLRGIDPDRPRHLAKAVTVD